MITDEQFPTSFRFTADELGQLDELAGLIYRRLGGRVTVSRKAALMVAIDLALAEEHARAQGAVTPAEVRTADSPRKWRCGLCERDIGWAHFKRHPSQRLPRIAETADCGNNSQTRHRICAWPGSQRRREC